MAEYQTFVVPYDFSEHAGAALRLAGDLARHLGADLHLVHVVQVPTYAYGYAPVGVAAAPAPFDMARLRDDATRSLRELVAETIANTEGLTGKIEFHVVEGTAIAGAICEMAEKLEADLIVMGTHGRTGLAHVFLGSVAERTLRNAHCPVLTVRAPEEAAKA